MSKIAPQSVGLTQLPRELVYQICELVYLNKTTDLFKLAKAVPGEPDRFKLTCFKVLYKNEGGAALSWAAQGYLDGKFDLEKTVDFIHRCLDFGDAHAKFNVIDGWKQHSWGSMIHLAVYLGDVKLVERLTQRGIDVNVTDSKTRTSLHRACSADYRNASAQVLIRHGANCNARDLKGDTPLFSMANLKDVAGVETTFKGLIAGGAEVNIVSNKNRSPLGEAAVRGAYRLLELLLEQQADVNLGTRSSPEQDRRGKNDMRPLYILLSDESGVWSSPEVPSTTTARLVRKMIDQGAELDNRVLPGLLRLKLGAERDLVHWLRAKFGLTVEDVRDTLDTLSGQKCDYGATQASLDYLFNECLPEDPRLLEQWGFLPKFLGSSAVRHPDIMRLAGAAFDPAFTLGRHVTLLMILLGNKHYDYATCSHVLDSLLDRGVEVNAQDYAGLTCVHHLLEGGFARVLAKEREKERETGDFSVKAYTLSFRRTLDKLLKRGLKLKHHSITKFNHLHHMAVSSRADSLPDCARILIAQGVDPTAKDSEGKTPLDLYRGVIERGHALRKPGDKGVGPFMQALLDNMPRKK
ncbi:ankyrin repeats (3 copies) domain-containing protein [Hirsutella rhossiliensis]|uniref:Ankyrin repeats (3 copies) domain-containing protein n=1 Tax=Hirsutella rhossiliensis TaxID=111463 RepID=A0A9P8SJM0_9HYPO|nr:ankyrin repeats (3 copies) domain-containing protein [Hirsutella rhossiliensis]KAH0965448.1 ankyrin repeats (3 copies) domain-containing protein [Hirsutella rhossiliensis]